MLPLHPRSKPSDTLFPYPTLVRSRPGKEFLFPGGHCGLSWSPPPAAVARRHPASRPAVPLPMQSILETVLPIFGLVFCGYVVGRKGWMSEEAIKGLNTFVFYFAIPALLFRAMAGGLGRSEEHTSELQSLMRT